MSVVTLAQASTIVDAALKKGRDTNCAPLTVAVLDGGGHLVAFKREDKSGLLRFDIAVGKAWGALGMGFGSRTLAGRHHRRGRHIRRHVRARRGLRHRRHRSGRAQSRSGAGRELIGTRTASAAMLFPAPPLSVFPRRGCKPVDRNGTN